MEQATIDQQLLELMLRAGSRWVLWLLIALSVLAVAVAAERIWFFVREARTAHPARQAIRNRDPGLALAQLSGPAAALPPRGGA